jgi:NAD(P)H-hydrate epimerase
MDDLSIDTTDMIEIDRIMMDELEIPVELMMENAGGAFARIAINYQSLHKIINPVFIAIVGTGHNGGGVLVAARRLLGWGKQQL